MSFNHYKVASYDEVDNQPKTYELCVVDADTILFEAAKALQENSIIVTHNKSGKRKQFPGVQKFYGTSRKAKDGGWIGDTNLERVEKGLPPLTVDDFTIEEYAELVEPEVGMTLIEMGLRSIAFSVGTVKKTMDADKYVLVIGGKGNFRYDAAQIMPYKGKRKEKPILFAELREAMIDQYKSKVMIARDGLEADDEVSIMGWESYKQFTKTGKHKYIIAFCDKDLKSIPCPYFNYKKPQEGITIPDIFDCAKHFAIQCLMGDKSTDNIPGLPNVSKEFGKKYGVGCRGVGYATAEKILEGCTTPKQLYEVVCEAYKSYYGEDPFEFTSFRGDVSTRTWIDMLKENAILLYMNRTFEEVGKYDISQTLKKMGVI